jgi:diguanylate cyclase (GGDEF)-like protein/PAS domain S-box-containing protein
MNTFDMKTVIISYIISNAICMVVVLFLYIQNRRRFAGLGFWLADFGLQFMALPLVVLRGAIPDFLSMTGNNTLIIGGTILLYLGLERFLGKRGPQWQNGLLLAVFIPLHTYFVLYPNLGARNILFSLGLLAIFAQISWLMLRGVDTRLLPLTRAVGIVFVVYSLVSVVRIVVALTTPSNNDFFDANVYDTLLVLLYQMLSIGLTFSLFLMVNQRLTGEMERDIEARICTENALKISEEKFQKAFHSSPDSITITRLKDGQIMEVNEGFFHFSGYSRDEVLGNSTIALEFWANPHEREAFVRTLQEKLRVRDVEYDFRSKSGAILNGLLSAEIIQFGNEPHILSVIHNITGRKQAEAALKESEQKFRLIFETMAHGIVYQDEQGYITSANPAAEKILGLTLDQMQGRTSIDPRWRAIHEDGSDFPGETHPAMVALRTGMPVSNVIMGVYNPQTDTYRWINVSAMPRFRHGETKPYQVYATFDDITERRQTETALRASDERYQAFIAQSFEAIYRTEFDHPIDISLPVETQIDLIYASAYMAECNQALADMYNLPSTAAMIGMRLLDAHGSNDNPVNRATFRKFIEGGYKSNNDETMEYDAFGNPIWFLSNTIGIVENGFLARMWGTSINITERKLDDEVFRIRLQLFDFASSHSLGELMQKALDEIGPITNSPIGFYHFVEADQQTLSLQAWSTRTLAEFCHAEGEGMHYPIEQAGVWAECIGQRKPVIHNDYAALPNRKGLPPGHAAITRELVVPILRDGRIVSILGLGNKPTDYNERDVRFVSYIADVVWEIVARKRAEEKLQQLSRAVEQNPASIVITDTSGRIEYVNPRFSQVTGYSAEEAIGQNPRLLKTGMTPQETYRTLWEAIRAGKNWQGEFVNRKKNGEIFYELASISPISDAHGSITHYVAVKEDITERKESQLRLQTLNEQLAEQIKENLKLQEILREQAIRDSLTGLYNRRYLDETMEREIARAEREKYPVSFLMIDNDRFKTLNDTYGHAAGDAVLMALGDLFHARIRKGDIACRYGGDEFLVIMPQADGKDAKRRAEEIRSDFHNLRVNVNGTELSPSISIGIAFYPQHGDNAEAVAKAADDALYQAKQAGRNCVRVWEEDL